MASANGDSQPSSEDDVAMAEAAESLPSQSELAAVEAKKEVKLDDLFADVDSDDEFPSSSRPAEAPKPSSPPPAPSSPMYVLCACSEG
jgi:DNA primase small subunit